MAQKEMKHMMRGAAVLTLASFIAKVLSAFYRVPFQNLVGDEGFYVYQQVYPLYGLAMTFALSGLPQFISKAVAEQKTVLEQEQVLKKLLPWLMTLAIVCWGGCFFGSQFIAQQMGDTALRPLIQVVSFTFLLMPVLSLYRGYFQGRLYMVPSALSQVSEQFIRVGVIWLAAYAFSRWQWSIYQTGTVAMAGSLAGGMIAVLVLIYYGRKTGWFPFQQHTKNRTTNNHRTLVKRLLLEGGLVSLYSALLIVFQLVDSFYVKNALVAAGYSEAAAKIAKGIYDRGQPFVQLGLVVALALCATFLPALTSHYVREEKGRFLQSAKIFLRLTTTIASAASAGLILLLPYMNFALFKDQQGQVVLSIYVLSIALMAVIQAYQSIMQSCNQFGWPLLGAGAGILIKLLTTHWFTLTFGTVGASLATILGLFVTFSLLLATTKVKINTFFSEKYFLVKLIVCLTAMVVLLIGYRSLLAVVMTPYAHRSLALLAAIIGVGVGAGGFLLVSLRIQLFTVREWLMLPFGAKILRMKRK